MIALRRQDLVGVLAYVVSTIAVLASLGLVVPGLGDGPDPASIAIAAVSGVLATLLWLQRDDPPRWLGHIAVVWVEIAILGVIAIEPDRATAGFLHLLLVWTGLLTFPFLSRRSSWLHTAVVTGIAATIWHGNGSEPVETAVAAVLLLGTVAGVGSVVAMPLERSAALARTDELTRVANRRGVMELLDGLAGRHERPTAGLVLLDLDGFKQVNDTHGHAAGDRLLRDLAARWSTTLPPGATIGRLGGDEFLVVLPTIDGVGIATVVARLRDVTPDDVGVSIGTTAWNPPETVDAALHRADEALYLAKRELTRRATDERDAVTSGPDPATTPGDDVGAGRRAPGPTLA